MMKEKKYFELLQKSLKAMAEIQKQELDQTMQMNLTSSMAGPPMDRMISPIMN